LERTAGSHALAAAAQVAPFWVCRDEPIMSYPAKEQLISIIGSSYFQPLTDLWLGLVACPLADPNEVQAARSENGYSASLCILAVTCLESYLMRVRFKNHTHRAAREKHPLDFLKSLYPDFSAQAALTEVFVLRDALVHNHLWSVDYTWDDESPMKLLKASLDSISGDSKFIACVDMLAKTTRLLQLNVMPIRVSRREFAKVVGVVWDTLLFLESKGRDLCYVSHIFVKRDGASVRFEEVVGEMRA
jgi:hypothetical protein